jgi:uncharacterized repeat protein (TIGR04138 family)
MSPRHPQLIEIAQRDPRYAYEAYEFVITAYHYTQKLLGRSAPKRGQKPDPHLHHISGRQLLDGIRSLALRDFGLMARTVFKAWGIGSTDDFGEIVFNLVEGELMSKTDEDTRDDFHNVFDLEDSLMRDYIIKIEDA